MKKSELKKILKPLVNECIKESLLEDGMISGIISEVVRGMAPSRTPAVPKATAPVDRDMERLKANAFSTQQSDRLKEHKTKLMEAIGASSYNGANLFEGTTPAPTQTTPQQQADPMSGQAPADPGVDISGLFGAVKRNWGAHMSDIKEGK
tara:strand:+ start:580 stop:1029 length:450 start_codon:yes stop_codon:yes gene_type:complete